MLTSNHYDSDMSCLITVDKVEDKKMNKCEISSGD